MAKRGRPRKPAEDHHANGTYRPGKHGPLPNAADPSDSPPAKPRGLASAVAAKWDAISPPLAHLLRPYHGGLLLELCRWLVRADELDAALAGYSRVDKEYVNLLSAASTATANLLALSQRFGLSPADRAKIKIVLPAGGAAAAKPKVSTRPRTKLDGAPPIHD